MIFKAVALLITIIIIIYKTNNELTKIDKIIPQLQKYRTNTIRSIKNTSISSHKRCDIKSIFLNNASSSIILLNHNKCKNMNKDWKRKRLLMSSNANIYKEIFRNSRWDLIIRSLMMNIIIGCWVWIRTMWRSWWEEELLNINRIQQLLMIRLILMLSILSNLS